MAFSRSPAATIQKNRITLHTNERTNERTTANFRSSNFAAEVYFVDCVIALSLRRRHSTNDFSPDSVSLTGGGAARPGGREDREETDFRATSSDFAPRAKVSDARTEQRKATGRKTNMYLRLRNTNFNVRQMASLQSESDPPPIDRICRSSCMSNFRSGGGNF